MTSSGTYAFNPALSDVVLDAFERIDVRPSAITTDHMFSVKRSLNFTLIRWSNRQPNQWVTEEVTTPLISGQQRYLQPSGTVAVLDVWCRNYLLGDVDDLTPAIATTNASASVTITWADHGLVADQWVNVPIPVAIGGLVIHGFYQVVSVPSTDTFTITASSNATSTASGGAVPSYATTADNATVTVTLTAHGYVAGETFTVNVQTTVGGLVLFGDYVITSTPTANTLTFEAASEAGSTDTESENDGDMQLAAAQANALATDHMLTPISRQEWAMIPSKSITSDKATSYWFDRQISPRLELWPIPELTAPQELRYYRLRQIQDANPQNTETADVPWRALEALCAGLAEHLSMKWNPDKYMVLKDAATAAWLEFAGEDRERVPTKIKPNVGSYYR